MPRDFCYRCMRPASSCLCPKEPPLETRTHIVLLMHPKEYRREKCGTGRLACLNLANSEIIPGVAFDDHPRVRELVGDPANYPVLLYPGPKAMNLSEGDFPLSDLGGRRLVVFLVDATWSCSRAVLHQSPGLLGLPQLKFEPQTLSRWVIKKQPRDYCLSTIESIHELLVALERAGLDAYPDKARLLSVFASMQDYQVERAEAAGRPRYKGT